MSQFQDVRHAFVQASARLSDGPSGGRLHAALAEDLAAAGDRLESVLREMIRDAISAKRDADALQERGWPF